jgi:Secretion system C-terminal sorting domain/Cohesin domain
MPKSIIFLLFTLFGLSVPTNAQNCESLRPLYSVNYPSFCNAPATVTVTYPPIGGVTYTFRLDGVASATNTWQNVANGRHTIGYTGSSGCNKADTAIVLNSSILQLIAEQQPVTNCLDTVFSYKFTAIGGQSPYQFSTTGRNGYTSTSNSHVLSSGVYGITITDATGCRTENGYLNVVPRRDSARTTATLIPNNPCATLATLTISVNDPQITRPFTISLNGGAFTSDTIFRNVPRYGDISYVVRSAQGCLYYCMPWIQGRTSALQLNFSNFCANRFGRGYIGTAVYGGAPPYKYTWSDMPQDLPSSRHDLPIGTYGVTVTDANGCKISESINLTTCVWPGDTDTSGVVNAADLLNIGLAFGERGTTRGFCAIDSSANGGGYCTVWDGQTAPFWSKQTLSGVNYKHIDANGNGLINHADTLPIIKNWSKTRTLRGDNPVVLRGAAPPILVQTGRVAEGQWAAFPIILGDATNTAKDVYGLAFSINYDPSVIDASSVYLSFGQNWLGSGDNVLRVFKNFNGTIEAAISRTNQQNGSGNGQIATLNFKTKAGMSGRNLSFSVDNQQVINKDAQPVPTLGQTTTTTVLTSTSEPDWANQIAVYPNPTTGKVIVESQHLDVKSVEVFDISGKSLFKTENSGKNDPPDLSGQALSIEHAGTYFLKIQTVNGVLMRKVVKL